jgi:hypothetical protein
VTDFGLAKHLAHGMAGYRTGKDDEALTRLHRCQEARNAYSASTALVFEAMTCSASAGRRRRGPPLGRADAMDQELEAVLAGSPSGPLGPTWVDVLISQIARREAGKIVIPRTPDGH